MDGMGFSFNGVGNISSWLTSQVYMSNRPTRRSRLDSLLHIVAAEMRRVFCLRIQDATGGDIFTGHRLLRTQAPSLQIFVCGGSKETLFSSFSGPLFGGHIPQLAIMDLACIALVPCQSSLAIRNLTILSLSNIPTNSWPKYSELLALLRNCEQVRNLQLMSAGPRDWEGNAETVLASQASPVNLPAFGDICHGFTMRGQEHCKPSGYF